jgi:hypothetical protein
MVLLLAGPADAQRRSAILADLPDLLSKSQRFELIAAETESDVRLLFVDKATIRSVGGFPRAWFTSLDSIGELTALIEADCRQERTRTLASFAYDPDDTLTAHRSQPERWVFNPPSSGGDYAVKYLCRDASRP